MEDNMQDLVFYQVFRWDARTQEYTRPIGSPCASYQECITDTDYNDETDIIEPIYPFSNQTSNEKSN